MAMNNILAVENASQVRRPTNIDSYDWTRFYDVNLGTQVPASPTLFTFRNENLQDWFDYSNGQLLLQFFVRLADPGDVATIRSDVRTWFDRVELRANGTLISSNANFYKWADFSRAQVNREYNDTIGSQMYWYDNKFWDASNLELENGGTVNWTAPPNVVMVDRNNVAIPTEYSNSSLSGFGKRRQLTTYKTGHDTIQLDGRILTASIPWRLLFPFFSGLRCCLKNVQFELTLVPRDPRLMVDQWSRVNATDPRSEVRFVNAYCEIPKVVPSALRLIELDKFLTTSPKLEISYSNYKVVRNELTRNVEHQLIRIDNIAQRLVRATSFVTLKTRDDPLAPVPAKDETIVPISSRDVIQELQFFVNSVSVPNSRIVVQQKDKAMSSLEDEIQHIEETMQIWKNYVELVGGFYENNPWNTENGLVTKFRNNGVYEMMGLSHLFPMMTVPLDRTRNSEEYISGSAQLSVELKLNTIKDLSLYNFWTIIEYIDNIDLQLEPTNAFISFRGTSGSN